MSHHTLDARRLLCPMPVIKVQNAVRKLNRDDTLDVICTDPGTKQDIPSWCRIYGHDILSIEDRPDDILIKIIVGEKKARP